MNHPGYKGRDSRIVLAVKGVQELGERIAHDSPAIADLYRAGETQYEIAKNILATLHSSFEITFVRRAVQFALRQLIPPEERVAIAQCHMKMGGKRSVLANAGIHAIPPSVKRAEGLRRAATGEGLFAIPMAERRKRVAEATGEINWEGEYRDPETGLNLGDYCFMLSKDPDYFISHGRHKGKPSSELIAHKLNEVFSDFLPKMVDLQGVRYYLNYRRSRAKLRSV